MVRCIVNDLAEASVYLLHGLAAGALCAAAMALANVKRRRDGRPPLRLLAPSCLVAYATVVLHIAFLSRPPGSRPGGIDWRLFATWGRDAHSHAYVLENVLLFVPYGFLLAWNAATFRRPFTALLAGALTSVALEGAQLLTARGYCQIDDVWANVIGMLLGTGAWNLGQRLVSFLTNREKPREELL